MLHSRRAQHSAQHQDSEVSTGTRLYNRLLDHLLGLEVLTSRQCAKVRCQSMSEATKALFTITTVMWLRLRRPCNVMQHRAMSCSHLWLRQWCSCDVTATRNKRVRFSARLQPITMQESVWAWSTSSGVIVHFHFHVFRLINKGNLFFSVIFLFNYVSFTTCIVPLSVRTASRGST